MMRETLGLKTMAMQIALALRPHLLDGVVEPFDATRAGFHVWAVRIDPQQIPPVTVAMVTAALLQKIEQYGLRHFMALPHVDDATRVSVQLAQVAVTITEQYSIRLDRVHRDVAVAGYARASPRPPDSALRCPDCGQPRDILGNRTYPVTDPDTGHTTRCARPIRYCTSEFHLVIPEIDD